MRGVDSAESGNGSADCRGGQGSSANDPIIVHDDGAIFCNEGIFMRKHFLQGGKLAARGRDKGDAELAGAGADRGKIWWKLAVAVQ